MKSLVAKKISELMTIAQTIMAGLFEYPEAFPLPPTDGKTLGKEIDNVTTLIDELVSLKAKKKEAAIKLNTAITQLKTSVDNDRDYIKYIGGKDPVVLTKFGLMPNKKKSDQRVPAQRLDFHLISRGKTTFEVGWKNPPRGSGGEGNVYCQVLGKEQGTEKSLIMANGIDNKAVIDNQETGKTFEFCVVAYNKVGTGIESNSIVITF